MSNPRNHANRFACTIACVGFLLAPSFGWAEEQPTAKHYAEIVQADQPVAYWRMNETEGTQFKSDAATTAGKLSASLSGSLELGRPGPRPGEFPLFTKQNIAVEFAGNKGFLRVKDPGAESPLDFDKGDALTLEAWISAREVGNGSYRYIVGKGRTNNPGVARDNQNYAMRLFGTGGSAALTFLYRSSGPEGDWHRWTSKTSLAVGDGWHHVAVTYTFGEKDSIKGYIDGKPVAGVWDMGGATDRGPVVDDDELWIGSSMGGSATSSFAGLLDEVAIYRTALKPERIAARYKFVAQQLAFDESRLPKAGVLVDIFEGIPDGKTWTFRSPRQTDSFVAPGFVFTDVPKKYNDKGLQVDRSNPYLIVAHAKVTLPEGKLRLLVRCRNAGRLYVDGKKVAETAFHSINANGHGTVWGLDDSLAANIRPLPRGDTQDAAEFDGDGQEHLLRFEMIVGGNKHRPELGETGVFLAQGDEDFKLLSDTLDVELTDAAWPGFLLEYRRNIAELSTQRRRLADKQEREYWDRRHEIAREIASQSEPPAVPHVSEKRPINNDVDRFLAAKLEAAGETPTELTSDLAFLRRVTLDVIGTIPTPAQFAAFQADDKPGRRARYIDRLLEHPGWADNWVGYWQDVLAENPRLVKPTLNNTGPFRWWIHESFVDNKPFDRFATELILMEGSRYYGGPNGFAMATQNDAPMAAKAHVAGQAFLGLQMKCARCHDAPFHDFKQSDLFSLAALLNRGPQLVPETSSVPGGEEVVKSLFVEVSLKPGTKVPPAWTFGEIAGESLPQGILRNPSDPRERAAALITSPHNQRFAQVIVNRLWRRYLGHGLVEPVDDWEAAEPSHPELLDYLARELVLSGYDLKHVARLILNSHAYQRQPRGREVVKQDEPYLFASPIVRRMSAEQIVDSLFLAAGKEFDAGPLTVDRDSSMSVDKALNLGEPTRAWQFTSLSNERDRPSLALPYAQPFVTFLETFGWRSSRQDPITVRNEDPTVLQPGIMANSILGLRITRLSDDSRFTDLALEDQPVERLIDRVFVRLLTRPPSDEERQLFAELLRDGYDSRIVENPIENPRPRLPRGMVSWSNHLSERANAINVELEHAVREGDPPTYRLTTDWRERMEDMIWTVMNSPEFVFLP